MNYLVTLAIAALLGLIPANIAKNKGHSFGLWWFYGWMLFIVAIIHVQFIEDLTQKQRPAPPQPVSPAGAGRPNIVSPAAAEVDRTMAVRSAMPAPVPAAERRPHGPVVCPMSPQFRGERIRLSSQETYVAGRSSECRICYGNDAPGVSGRHCAITWDSAAGEFIVKDMNSSYGTFLSDGTRLNPDRICRLRPGSSIFLGGRANEIRLETE